MGATATVPGDLLDHRLHRGEAGAARDHQQRAVGTRIQHHPPEGRSETELVTGRGRTDQCRRHRPAVDQSRVQLDLTTTWGIGGGVHPPFARSHRARLDRDGLPGYIRMDRVSTYL